MLRFYLVSGLKYAAAPALNLPLLACNRPRNEHALLYCYCSLQVLPAPPTCGGPGVATPVFVTSIGAGAACATKRVSFHFHAAQANTHARRPQLNPFTTPLHALTHAARRQAGVGSKHPVTDPPHPAHPARRH